MTEGDGSLAKPPPGAEGTLEKSPLGHLLVYSLEKRLSGTFVFTAPDGRNAQVVVTEGYLGKARSDEPFAALSDILVAMGFVDKNVMRTHLTRVGVLDTNTLLEEGVLTIDNLDLAMKQQVAQRVIPMFGWPSKTTYAFYRNWNELHDVDGHFFRTVHVFPVLRAGTFAHPPWAHIIPIVNRTQQQSLRILDASKLKKFAWGPEFDGALDALTHQGCTQQELAKLLPVPSWADLLLYCLIITKQLKMGEPRRSIPAPSMPPPAGLGVFAHAAVGSSAMPAMPLRQPSVPSFGPPVGSVSPPPLGPPMPFVPDAAPPVRESSYAGTPPMDVMSTGDYMASAAASAQTGHRHPSIPPAGNPSLRPPRTSDFDLGYNNGRDYGPGRISVPPPAITISAEDAGKSEALGYYAHAQQATAAQQWDRAELFCRKAILAEPRNGAFRALFAWVEYARMPGASGAEAKAFAAMDRAIAVDMSSVDAFYYRGLLYQHCNDGAKAMRDFQHCVHLAPDHPGAGEAIARVQLRTPRR